MSKGLRYISNTLQGVDREKNQDQTLVIENKHYSLFMVFDGVSSYPYSYLYIKNFIQLLLNVNEKKEINPESLEYIFFQTHKELLYFEPKGMSTLSLVCINHEDPQRIYTLNIGDSPVYSITKRSIEKISKDDLLHAGSNILTKCLGMKSLEQLDFKPNSKKIEGKLLLCSDGFANLMETNLKEYFKAFCYKRLTTIKRKLFDLQQGKNEDDATFILIDR